MAGTGITTIQGVPDQIPQTHAQQGTALPGSPDGGHTGNGHASQETGK